MLKFVWRHVLTLCVFAMMSAALLQGQISWAHCFQFYIGAIFFDWLKMKIKFDPSYTSPHSFEEPKPLHVRDYWNSSLAGSPSYLSSMDTSSRYY